MAHDAACPLPCEQLTPAQQTELDAFASIEHRLVLRKTGSLPALTSRS
jgi:hypothetical protein